MAPDDPDRLESWKEIAAFICRDERTAMRWAAQGMPVHRVPAGKRGRVFASREEISNWLGLRDGSTSQAVPAARLTKNKWRIYVVAGSLGALALLLSAAVFFSRRSRAAQGASVNRVTFTSDAVVAWHDNRQLWEHEFSRPLASRFWGPLAKLSDFVRILSLGHGKRLVVLVAPFRLDPNPDSSFEQDVDCFSNGGKLLWSYVAHEKFQFGQNELQGPWNVTALYVSGDGGKPSIWVAEDHHEWGNTFVVQLDAENGHPTVRFVNTGVLYCLNEVKTPTGTYLLAGGFNNEYSSGILAVINEKKPFAVSPQTPGTRHKCVSCAPGVPDEYFVFPRTEVNRVEGIYQDPVRQILVDGDEIEVSNMELQANMSVRAIYLFRTTPTFRPISLRYDTGYDMLYRQLKKDGKIHYSIADAPERLHPLPVSVWTPAGGWEDYAVRPPGIIAANPLPISKPPRYLLAAETPR